MPDAYSTLMEQLQHAVERLGEVAERRSSGIVAAGAGALCAKLAEERFNVVVVGEFKRGKTTFVNALLGAEILPTAVAPLASIITALVWGREIRAEVAFQDGRVEAVDHRELDGLITERGNPGNRLGVDRATVSYPSDYLRGGVLLVDTPGVGSVYGHNTDAVYAFVPEADAAIFLTSADQPVSANERAFLEEVSAEAARMFFVLNKTDHLSARDLAESLAFTRRVLGETLAREVDVYPVSARMGWKPNAMPPGRSSTRRACRGSRGTSDGSCSASAAPRSSSRSPGRPESSWATNATGRAGTCGRPERRGAAVGDRADGGGLRRGPGLA
jgi:GTPase SAR1 family protein